MHIAKAIEEKTYFIVGGGNYATPVYLFKSRDLSKKP